MQDDCQKNTSLLNFHYVPTALGDVPAPYSTGKRPKESCVDPRAGLDGTLGVFSFAALPVIISVARRAEQGLLCSNNANLLLLKNKSRGCAGESGNSTKSGAGSITCTDHSLLEPVGSDMAETPGLRQVGCSG